MSILVTRPSPDAEILVDRLRAQGLEAWSFPLIEFSPGLALAQLPARLNTLQADDLVFVVSRHTVQYADAELRRCGQTWPSRVNYFAIGRATALALHQACGMQVSYPRDREISEVLLQLPELQNISGKKALILRGNGGRELLGETLTARGASVEFYECYQRREKVYDGAQEAWRWHERGVDTLVVTSGEMLQQFFRLVPEWYRTRWLLRCKIVVVSERLANLARELGWHDIKVADHADNDALLRALL